MSSISIIVPRLGTKQDFETTLAAVLRYRLPRHQVVVVQAESQPSLDGLSDEVDFVSVAGHPSLIRLFNQGVSRAHGEIVNLIYPGVQVTEHWFLYAIRALQTRQYGSAIPSIVDEVDPQQPVNGGVAVSWGMNRRLCNVNHGRTIGPSAMAAFYQRRVLEVIGPVDEALSDQFLDIDLALTMKRLQLKTIYVPESILTIPAERRAVRLPIYRGGRDSQRMIQRHAGDGTPSILGQTVLAVTRDMAGCLTRPARLIGLAGRMNARSSRATDRAFRRRLDLVHRELTELGFIRKQMVKQSDSKRAA